ncbi:hypothetical protein Bhyg_04746 [Pseudolycoriella hygida]|uniref:Protein quiver n=1 Tax=Pseudolycoriella hygida TaxID=35572 RepID=A0A9Q0SAD2_9DIPT|nr:hypothetical protein Bhyg_04746 [Pseudolycoriella hygida]
MEEWKLCIVDVNASGLRCWRCSSDATTSKFCGETLDLSEISEHQKRWSYVECDKKTPQYTGKNKNLIPKCRILLQNVDDVPTYTRSCFYEEEHVPSDSCANQKYEPSFVKTVSCYTCTEDGCNDKLVRRPAETAVNTLTF